MVPPTSPTRSFWSSGPSWYRPLWKTRSMQETPGKIQAKLIVEAANGPTTSEADEILAKRGIEVVPDILANAGGVVVSYFEWVQNIQSVSWTEDEVNKKLKDIMDAAFESVWDLTQEKHTTLRMGAY